MAPIKRIGILTSGGDCAGLNAVIRAVAHRAISGYGWQVLGIRNGTAGLLARPVEAAEVTLELFGGTLLRQGGTILGTTNKGDPFAYPRSDGRVIDRSQEVIDGYRQLGLDALIGIGGDGSFAILRRCTALRRIDVHRLRKRPELRRAASSWLRRVRKAQFGPVRASRSRAAR